MQKLQCELCGSIDFVRTNDGFFKCEACGCKYTLEQARTVLSGEVKVTPSDFSIRGGVLEKYNGSAVDVAVPDDVVSIGASAFNGLKVRSVKLPERLEEIQGHAFGGCSSLKEITIPENVKKIGEYAFGYCSSLNVTVLGNPVVYNTTFYKVPGQPSSDHFPPYERRYKEYYEEYIQVKQRNERRNEVNERRNKGLCTFCGGRFIRRGLFLYCEKCGKKKTYHY